MLNSIIGVFFQWLNLPSKLIYVSFCSCPLSYLQIKTVLSGWHCIKAELKNDPKIIAWFTLDIPLSYGPWGYYGLPGLIVQMQTPVYILHLNEVTSTDGIELNPPSTGEAISQKDFDKLVGKSDKERFKSADKVTYH